ncbi:MAG: hypothetical protein HZA79_12415 [Sphingobacteriales bacterium]|nr:hypothetical protein [Sphingobacteriales bacterium]
MQISSLHMQTNQTNIYQLLDHLRVRKAMYLGNDYNFKSLDNFIGGFTMAASDEQLQLNDYPNFSYFSTWLLGHLQAHFGLSGGWYWQITNRNPNNDENAFEKFFSFLEVFKTSKTHSKSINVDKDAIEFNKTSNIKRFETTEGESFSVEEKPFKIIWTTIDNSTTVWLDYLDQNGNATFSGLWTISADEASKNLANEFGSFKNNWKNHN